MAGIYIHVPFCKTRCIYCDFFTQTNISTKPDYVTAVCTEMALRKQYLGDEIIKTIYFGGGTPSQLTIPEFRTIFEAIYTHFIVDENVEITIEANPDDLSDVYLDQLRLLPINRISVGIQSFNDNELHFLKRRHSSDKAKKVIARCKALGYDNISIDLMYGLPNQTMPIWQNNLEQAVDLGIQHISAYHLIYEEDTRLYKLLQQGSVQPVDENVSVDMFSVMIDRLTEAGFVHYEISNFARDGLFSRHNSSYWLGDKYLGLGPAAHSFDGRNRAWNVSSIAGYFDGVGQGHPIIETEQLDIKSAYNDFILTGMRTMWGVSLSDLKKRFGDQMLNYCMKNVQKHINLGTVINDNNTLKLTRDGIFVSDGVMSDLMYI